MKYILIILTSLCLNLAAFSQSYQIEQLGSNYSQSEIDLAFGTVNWCERSYKNKVREIVLDDGAIVHVLPATIGCGQEDEFSFAQQTYAIRGAHLVMGQISSSPAKVRPSTINQQ